MGFEDWAAAAGDLLLGAHCHGCEQPRLGLRPTCRQELGTRQPFFAVPAPRPDGFPLTVTPPRTTSFRRLINAHKERQALILTRVLAERLAVSVHALLTHRPYAAGIVLVPIPSAARTVRQRGFDATSAMARTAARRLRAQYPATVRSVLVQARPVADQAGLGARARQQNLAGAFRLRRPITAGAAVIVDDLVTTGSSLTEAARVLHAAGIPVLGAATVAATVRLQTSSWRTENSVRIPGSGRNTR